MAIAFIYYFYTKYLKISSLEQLTFTLVSIILILVGIAGTILPILPGLLLSFAGILLYKFLGNPEFSIIYVLLFAFLTLVSLILNYVIPIKTTTKYGGSRYGKIGGFLGTVIGLFFPPIGFIIGMLLGVFLAELIHDRADKKKAFNATKGAFIGFIYGTGFNLLVGLAMFLVVLIDILKK